MKALVLGGTGFIGRRLVQNLLKEGNEVTLATSGSRENPFGDQVSLIKTDRFRLEELEKSLPSDSYFDVLFDQINFSVNDSEIVGKLFKGRIGHYVFVSSAAVYYSSDSDKREEDFDPNVFKILEGGMDKVGYSDGKRSAEAYFFQRDLFPTAAARFPIVWGYDDTTMRFQELVKKVASGEEIIIPKKSLKRSYVWVEDAGRFLSWLGSNRKTGPYNGTSTDSVDAREMIGSIGTVLGKEPVLTVSDETKEATFSYTSSQFVMSVEKAKRDGFEFTPFKQWFKEEVRKTADSLGV